MSAVHKEILAVVNETLMTTDERFTADRFYPGEGVDAVKREEFKTLFDEGYFMYYPASDVYKFTAEGLREIGVFVPETHATEQPATAPDGGGALPHPEALAAQIVHAQMVLQDALGYEENDYNVSLVDLALDIEALRAQLAAAEATAAGLREALEPFADAWLEVPDGLRSSLRIWNGEIDEDRDYPTIGMISTDTLKAAHTALAADAKPAGGA